MQTIKIWNYLAVCFDGSRGQRTPKLYYEHPCVLLGDSAPVRADAADSELVTILLTSPLNVYTFAVFENSHSD
jgi:hypothetical protein